MSKQINLPGVPWPWPVVQLVGESLVHQKVSSPIPGQGTCRALVFDPRLGCMQRQLIKYFFHIDVSFSPFLSL